MRRKLSRSLSRSSRSERRSEGSEALVLTSSPEMQQESAAAGSASSQQELVVAGERGGDSVGDSVGEFVGEGYLDLTILEKYPHAFDLLPSAEVVSMDDEQLAALPVELMRTYHFYTASQTELIDAFATACRGGDDANDDVSAAVGAGGGATCDSSSQEVTDKAATRSEEATPAEAAPTLALTASSAPSAPSNMRQFV